MELKVCRTCQQELSISDFSVLSKHRKSGIKYNCDCNNCRATRRRENSKRTKALAVEYKGGKCNDCLQVVHQAAFEFHHLDPKTKEKDLTHFLNDRAVLTDKAKQELDKCVLLCANCHRVRHFSDLL